MRDILNGRTPENGLQATELQLKLYRGYNGDRGLTSIGSIEGMLGSLKLFFDTSYQTVINAELFQLSQDFGTLDWANQSLTATQPYDLAATYTDFNQINTDLALQNVVRVGNYSGQKDPTVILDGISSNMGEIMYMTYKTIEDFNTAVGAINADFSNGLPLGEIALYLTAPGGVPNKNSPLFSPDYYVSLLKNDFNNDIKYIEQNFEDTAKSITSALEAWRAADKYVTLQTQWQEITDIISITAGVLSGAAAGCFTAAGSIAVHFEDATTAFSSSVLNGLNLAGSVSALLSNVFTETANARNLEALRASPGSILNEASQLTPLANLATGTVASIENSNLGNTFAGLNDPFSVNLAASPQFDDLGSALLSWYSRTLCSEFAAGQINADFVAKVNVGADGNFGKTWGQWASAHNVNNTDVYFFEGVNDLNSGNGTYSHVEDIYKVSTPWASIFGATAEHLNYYVNGTYFSNGAVV